MRKLLTIIAVLFITASTNAQEVKEYDIYKFVNVTEDINGETQKVFMTRQHVLITFTDNGYYNESVIYIPFIDTVEVYGRYLKVFVNENHITTIKAKSNKKAVALKNYLVR